MDPKKELEKIIKNVVDIRKCLPNEQLPGINDVEPGESVENDLTSLYAQHQFLFEKLSEKLLSTKIKTSTDEKNLREFWKTYQISPKLEGKNSKMNIKILKFLDQLAKEEYKEFGEIKIETGDDSSENLRTFCRENKELICEVLKLKETKKHIAKDRLRASNKTNESLKKAAEVREQNKKEPSNFKGIPNSIQITDIHNDMYHFLLGMTEPIGNPLEAAFNINLEEPLKQDKNTKQWYPNLEYNPKFKGTITFGGDLIQSHDSSVKDDLGAIPLCLAMRHCMEQTPQYIIDKTKNLLGNLDKWRGVDQANMIRKNLKEILRILEGKNVESMSQETKSSKLDRLFKELRGPESLGAAGTDQKRNVPHGDNLVKAIGELKEVYDKNKNTIEKVLIKEAGKIIYVAGNHEMEALNEEQHPEVRKLMQDMFNEGLVQYCHYDGEKDTFISHTKLNKPLIEVILNKFDDKERDKYKDLFLKDKNNSYFKKDNKYQLSAIDSSEKRKLLAQLLNENFAKHFKVDKDVLFAPDPEGINDFAIVGEELERTYFRNDRDESGNLKNTYSCCEDTRNKFTKNNDELKKLETLKDIALVLAKAKDKVKIRNSKETIKNFNELGNKLKNSFTIEVKNDKNKTTHTIEKDKNNNIIFKKNNKKIGESFTLEEATQLFAQAINSNLNSRPYSLMNRGALCNFSGGLFGYKEDHPEEALDLRCNHVVGHRPTLLQKSFISINEPIVTYQEHGKTTLQTDYNGKNENAYINCRITVFDENGKPHLVGVSRMLDEHIEYGKQQQDGIISELARLCDDLYQPEELDKNSEKKINNFIKYFLSNPLGKTADRQYFNEAGKVCGLALKNDIDIQKSIKNFTTVKEYQQELQSYKEKLIKKQNNIKKLAKINVVKVQGNGK